MQFKLNQTNLILIGGVGLLAIYAYNKGWFSGSGKGYNVPPTQTTDGSTPTAPTTDPRYKNLATNFRNSLLDNSTSYDIFANACDSLLSLNDADLISVSNAYNDLFKNEDFKTLRDVLAQEWCYWSDSIKKRDELLRRFTSLGI
jgi:hypothetical protein